jgi:malonyl-CoA O-methyltransferase
MKIEAPDFYDKRMVASAFNSGAATYDKSARVQKEVAKECARLIGTAVLPACPRILEIGCGTGCLSQALTKIHKADLLFTDISERMLEKCRENTRDSGARYRLMDGEHPNIQHGEFDLICSSLAFQWFNRLSEALRNFGNMLSPGGYLVFATMGPKSLQEVRHASRLRQVALPIRVYPTARDISNALTGAWVRETQIVEHYTDGLAFFTHLKRIGAHAGARNYTLGCGELRRMLRHLGSDISITYHIIYGIWRKG